MKVIDKGRLSSSLSGGIVDEVRLQRRLFNCANVIKIFKIFEDSKELKLLMEYKEGGNLKQSIINRSFIPEEEIKIIMA